MASKVLETQYLRGCVEIELNSFQEDLQPAPILE